MQAARGASLNPSDADHPPVGRSRPRPDRARHLRLFTVITVLAYLVDLTSKSLVVDRLTDRGRVRVVGDLLSLDLARNPGAAFSTGTSYTVVLSCVAIAAAVAVLWVARRLGSTGWAVALGLLLAGILGNLTDRVFRSPGFLRGHVVDFLQLPHWPIFNVADMCINVAAALIIVQAFRGVTVSGARTAHARDRGGSDQDPDDEATQ
ncbi:MAG TPA: signal peptidase II [Nocardioidaceae bacterium]|nr:signal peptidase II [Nocardioidaceae bacterium]